MDNAMISSEKIMQKLKEIKRTFAQNPAQNEMMQPYLRTSEVQSRQNQRLRKYLPESMAKLSAQRPDFDLQPKHKEADAITFRKSLENKLENLFNEEKSLLRKRYQMSHDTDQYQRSLRDLENKYDRHHMQPDHLDHSFKSHSDHIKDMEDKIRQLERKYRQTEKNPPLPPPPTENIQQRSAQKRKTKQSEVWRNEMNELREELQSLKKANSKLRTQMNKRQATFQASRLIEQRTEVQKSLMKQVEKLRKEIQDLKNKRSPKKEVCEARVASRVRAQSERESKQRKVRQEQLLELYSQIDELKYKLNRSTKQKMLLEERNNWLQQQLNNLLSK